MIKQNDDTCAKLNKSMDVENSNETKNFNTHHLPFLSQKNFRQVFLHFFPVRQTHAFLFKYVTSQSVLHANKKKRNNAKCTVTTQNVLINKNYYKKNVILFEYAELQRKSRGKFHKFSENSKFFWWEQKKLFYKKT